MRADLLGLTRCQHRRCAPAYWHFHPCPSWQVPNFTASVTHDFLCLYYNGLLDVLSLTNTSYPFLDWFRLILSTFKGKIFMPTFYLHFSSRYHLYPIFLHITSLHFSGALLFAPQRLLQQSPCQTWRWACQGFVSCLGGLELGQRHVDVIWVGNTCIELRPAGFHESRIVS